MWHRHHTSRDHYKRVGGKIVRARGQRRQGWTNVFWTRYNCCPPEPTAAVVAYTRPTEDKAICQHAVMETGGVISPTPSWGTTDSWWLLAEEDCLLQGCGPGRLTTLQRMTHPICMWAELTGLSRLFKKKRTGSWEEVGVWELIWKVLSERVGSGYNQNTLCAHIKFSNS